MGCDLLVDQLTNWLATLNLGSIALNIISFVVVLGVLVFIHELGHFAVAKWSGVRVHEFALGFGPAILKRRIGETLYAVRILPLGGFVKMAGMEPTETLQDDVDETENDERAFHRRPISHRLAIIAAGPLMNLALAVVLHAIVISMLVVTVGMVSPNSPAEQAGLQAGDRFVSVAGRRVVTMDQVLQGIHESAGGPVRVVVDRNGENHSLLVHPVVEDGEQGVPRIGIEMMMGLGAERRPVGESLVVGAQQTWANIVTLIQTLGRFVTGQEKMEVAGPIGIYQMTGAFVEGGAITMLSFVAALSISLGVFNLLPVPILDGGGIMLLIIEAFRGRPLSPETRGMAQLVGLSLLLLLLMYATFQDLSRLGSDDLQTSMHIEREHREDRFPSPMDKDGVGAWRYS